MGNIVLLDDLTINKIAAGEVIERPASVVKEMVENSIDAGATNISVEIQNGGISLIKITDNGKGISEDDLEIAFERHATSKIRQASDLETVSTMGFRGEALASIAAIANVEVISRTEKSNIGNRLVIEGGKVLEKSEVGSPIGTTMIVRNLFYNTPVRYKFLKKDYTESGYIEDVITRIALVNKNVAIKLINNGKTVIQTNGNNDSKSVIYSIFGKDIATGIIDVNYDYEDIKVTGIVGKPEIARSNRSNQIFFVNSRYIKDKNLTAAAEQAYKGMLPIGRYGFLVLNIEMDPKKVDVNVHPAKLEVRFEDENKVFKAVYHAIKSGIMQEELVENVSKEQTKEEKQEENAKTTLNFDKIVKPEEIAFKANEEKLEENEKKGNLFSSLFDRIKKNENIENEKDAENKLEEIYNFRRNLKEIEGKSSNNLNSYETENKIRNSIENTMELNTTSLKNKMDMANTTEIETVGLKNLPNMDETAILGNLNELIKNNSEERKIEETANMSDKSTIRTPSEEDVEKATRTLLQNDLDRTQIIDTEDVRESLKDSFEEILEKRKKQEENIITEDETFSDFDEMYKKTFGVRKSTVTKDEPSEVDNMTVFENGETYVQNTPYKYIGTAFSTYIIIEMNKELYIIDQHASHERIMYEKIKQNYYSDDEKESQLLLIPDVITLTHKDMEIAKENIKMFEKAGFTLEEFGENTIKLTGVPNICIDLNTKQLFLDILDEINTVAVTARQEIEERFIATIACKSAVKANMNLDEKEVDNLMKELLKLPNPFTCPHGRPTAIKMTKNDLEKKFSRR